MAKDESLARCARKWLISEFSQLKLLLQAGSGHGCSRVGRGVSSTRGEARGEACKDSGEVVGVKNKDRWVSSARGDTWSDGEVGGVKNSSRWFSSVRGVECGDRGGVRGEVEVNSEERLVMVKSRGSGETVIATIVDWVMDGDTGFDGEIERGEIDGEIEHCDIGVNAVEMDGSTTTMNGDTGFDGKIERGEIDGEIEHCDIGVNADETTTMDGDTGFGGEIERSEIEGEIELCDIGVNAVETTTMDGDTGFDGEIERGEIDGEIEHCDIGVNASVAWAETLLWFVGFWEHALVAVVDLTFLVTFLLVLLLLLVSFLFLLLSFSFSVTLRLRRTGCSGVLALLPAIFE